MRNDSNTPTRLPLLSQTAEHALRAVLYLGRHEGRGLVSSQEIADALGAPPNYLSKILRMLAKRGILRSLRGPNGGFQLAAAPKHITPAQVVQAVDDVAVPATCLLGDRLCDPDDPCAVHERWSALSAQVLAPLQSTSIADLLSDTNVSGDPS